MDWQPIETAPKDGTVIRAKRVHDGRVVKEGAAVWGVSSPDAPLRLPEEPDPLGRPPIMSAAEWNESADRPRWLTEDRMFSFPTPTHWRPLNA